MTDNLDERIEVSRRVLAQMADEARMLRAENVALNERVDDLRDQVGVLSRSRDEWESNAEDAQDTIEEYEQKWNALNDLLRDAQEGRPFRLCDKCLSDLEAPMCEDCYRRSGPLAAANSARDAAIA